MKIGKFNVVLAACCLVSAVASPGCAWAGGVPPVQQQDKKIIEYGWDTPIPGFIRDHVAEWQDQPFDGIVFSLSDNGGQVFDLQSYDPDKIQPQIQMLTGLPWGRFTDNFLQMTCGSTMDWTSDADWNTVLAHTKLCALAAKAAGCKGYMFDPEPYVGIDPWDYRIQVHNKTMTFQQYSAVVRARGRQFATVLQEQIPNMKFMTCWQYSKLVADVGPIQDPNARDAALSATGYGLLPSFLDGMLEASNPQVQFIDGNEISYYYQYERQFTASRGIIHHDAALFVAPELRSKFARQERAAEAVYADYIFNLVPKQFPGDLSRLMTPDQRDLWLESNLYYALKSSDEYVWFYTENFRWWPPSGPFPPGVQAAIPLIKAKVANRQPLGFDITPIMMSASVRKYMAYVGL